MKIKLNSKNTKEIQIQKPSERIDWLKRRKRRRIIIEINKLG